MHPWHRCRWYFAITESLPMAVSIVGFSTRAAVGAALAWLSVATCSRRSHSDRPICAMPPAVPNAE